MATPRNEQCEMSKDELSKNIASAVLLGTAVALALVGAIFLAMPL